MGTIHDTAKGGGMSKQDVSDVQIVIDKMFDKLDNAKSGGEITQYNHSLRVQITKKKKMGAALTEREKDMIAAMGQIQSKKNGNPLWMVILIAAIIGGLYVAYRYLSHHPSL